MSLRLPRIMHFAFTQTNICVQTEPHYAHLSLLISGEQACSVYCESQGFNVITNFKHYCQPDGMRKVEKQCLSKQNKSVMFIRNG